MKKFPTTKDFVYWIIGLFIVIIYLLTLKLTKNSEVVDFISFAATIISIILAVVAMVYAYLQGNQSSKNNTETQSALTEIKTHVSGIGQLKTDIALSNQGIKDVKDLTHKLSREVNYANKSEKKIDELIDEKTGGKRLSLDFQIVCIPLEFDFNNPKKIDVRKYVHEYVTHYRKITDDDGIAFNVEDASDFGFSFNIGLSDVSMTPNRLKAILESYHNHEVKILTVARLIFAD